MSEGVGAFYRPVADTVPALAAVLRASAGMQ
jgi:hypothetical protein